MAEMLDIQTAQIIKGHLVGVSVTLTDQLFGVLRTAHFMINTVYTSIEKWLRDVGENQMWMIATVEH